MSEQNMNRGEIAASQAYADDEIDLFELFKTLWDGKLWIIITTVVFALGGVIHALSQTHVYRAEVLLAPAQSQSSSGLSGQLGGLAALAGVDVRGSGGNQVTIAIETIKSRSFLLDFIERHDLWVPLFAMDEFDVKSGEWTIDTSRFDVEAGEWIQQGSDPAKPSDWQAYRAFSGLMEVNQDRDGLIKLSITHPLPQLAKQWVDLLVSDINEYMRNRAIADGERTIAFLEGQIARTSAAGMQQVFYQLIEEQMKNVMLANVREEFMFRTIDPAMVPESPSGSSRRLIVMIATLLGGMIGVFAVLIRHMIQSRRELNP